MNSNSNNALRGTQTEQNLINAAKAEALASTKYKIYSDLAKKEGYIEAADMMRHFADNEHEHAELWLEYLYGTDSTPDNMNTAKSNEEFEATDFYPLAAQTAMQEGFGEIADKFRMASVAEANHRLKLSDMIESIASGDLHTGDAETEWKCTNCGYCTHGNMPPENCPLCGHPKGYFKK